ncbi:hypothetical protein SAMN04488063_1785 [Halopelagius inordinatus]|uniref:Uncharacterized protein n=1 Tax=Halopelagius inordinatus TaxID=553467 RepID=A0A1I2RAI1_9EURY|nr:hypothetical protein SAMN04488063_1785 [Halopelagius inordinatus]
MDGLTAGTGVAGRDHAVLGRRDSRLPLDTALRRGRFAASRWKESEYVKSVGTRVETPDDND